MAAAIEVQTRGADKIKGLGERLSKEVKEGERRGVEKARAVVLRAAVDRVSRVSDVPLPRFLRVQTGALRASLVKGSSDPPEFERGTWQAVVGVAEGIAGAYAGHHEYSDRSYLRSSLKEKKRVVNEIIRDEINAALKRA